MVGRSLNLPTPYQLEIYTAGPAETDRYGNKRPGKGLWKSVAVSSWWIDRTEEKGEDSVLRTIDYIHVHAPIDSDATAASKIRLPDKTEWEVIGNPENYQHGWHGWVPDLVVLHGRRVTG